MCVCMQNYVFIVGEALKRVSKEIFSIPVTRSAAYFLSEIHPIFYLKTQNALWPGFKTEIPSLDGKLENLKPCLQISSMGI